MKRTNFKKFFAMSMIGALCINSFAVPAVASDIQTISTSSVKQVKKLKLNKTSCTLEKGSKLKLKVKNTTDDLIWSSSNKKVVTVNKNGKITAIKKGTATITVKLADNKKIKAVCKVKVVKAKSTESITETTTEIATTEEVTTEVATTEVATTEVATTESTTEAKTEGNHTTIIIFPTPSPEAPTTESTTEATEATTESTTEATEVTTEAKTEATTEAPLAELEFEIPKTSLSVTITLNGKYGERIETLETSLLSLIASFYGTYTFNAEAGNKYVAKKGEDYGTLYYYGDVYYVSIKEKAKKYIVKVKGNDVSTISAKIN